MKLQVECDLGDCMEEYLIQVEDEQDPMTVDNEPLLGQISFDEFLA